jgi:hypothetical protein
LTPPRAGGSSCQSYPSCVTAPGLPAHSRRSLYESQSQAGWIRTTDGMIAHMRRDTHLAMGVAPRGRSNGYGYPACPHRTDTTVAPMGTTQSPCSGRSTSVSAATSSSMGGVSHTHPVTGGFLLVAMFGFERSGGVPHVVAGDRHRPRGVWQESTGFWGVLGLRIGLGADTLTATVESLAVPPRAT